LIGRRLNNLFTLLSLVLLVAVAGLWVWSRVTDWAWRYAVPGEIHVDVRPAGDRFEVYWARVYVPQPIRLWRLTPDRKPGGFAVDLARSREYDFFMVGSGLRVETAGGGGPRPWPATGFHVRFAFVDFTVPALVAATLPAARLGLLLRRRIRQRHLARAGLCPACGYDLRETPDRCPERGRDVVRRQTP